MMKIHCWPEGNPGQTQEIEVASPLAVKEAVFAAVGVPARVNDGHAEFRLWDEGGVIKLEAVTP